MTGEDMGSRGVKVLVLTSTYPRWQGDHEPGFVHELSKRLSKSFQVTVLGPHAKGAVAEEHMEGVRVLRYRYAPETWETLVNDGGITTNLRRNAWKWMLVPSFLVAMLWRAWLEIRRWRPDVIHAHWLIPQGLIAAMLVALYPGRLRFIVTSHGADLFALRGRILEVAKRFVIRSASATTVVSEAMLDELTRIGADVSKAHVMAMGVDLVERFTPDARTPRSSNEILFVGRLVEKKGLRYLLDAMPIVLAQCPDAHLSIVGFGPEEKALRAQTKALGLDPHVHFGGAAAQVDLPDMYRKATLFVAPFVESAGGDKEGLGLVVVEALGCGCPAIVSDLAATRQVRAGARWPMRVSPGDAAALARCIVALLQGGPAQYSVEPHAREALAAQFDWGAVTKNYVQLLTAMRAI